jgi:hypothetical protein
MPWGCLERVATAVLLANAALAAADWPAQSFRRAVIGADPHNADRMLAQIEEVAHCGADTVIFTGHLRGEAWFPSQFATPAPNLAVPDVVAEGVRRCHDRGMRAVVYVGAPLIQTALQDRLDWRQRTADGQPTGQEPACCLLSPFGDWLIDYLAELAAHAPVDGLWLDGYPQAVLACACPHCAQRYRQDAGADLPSTGEVRDAGFRRYVVWWHQRCEEHARRLVERLHQASPHLAVFANCATGRSPEAWRFTSDGLCALLDSPSVEQFWQVDRPGDPLQPLFAIDLLSAAADGQPVEVFVPLLPHMVDCTMTLPEVEMLARNLTVLANGAVPQSTYGPGRRERFAQLMAQIRQREPYLIGARRMRYCGIAASTLTGLHYGRDQAEKEYWEEVKGWLRALTEAHLPVELLSDRQLEQGRWEGLQVLILPSTACLSPEAQRKIRDFVAHGGGLVATAVASLADAQGDLAPDFGLADLLGAHFRSLGRAEPLPAFMSLVPRDHPLSRGEWVEQALWQQWSCLGHTLGAVGLPGKFVALQPPVDGEVAWQFPDGTPAVLTRTVGQGRTVYLSPEVGTAYYRYGYPYLRSLMAAAVQEVAAQPPPATVLAPLRVQASFFEQGTGRRIVHLLNEVSSFGRASLPAGALPLREEVIPVGGVRVQIAGPVGRFHLEPEGLDLTPRVLPDGRLEVALPPLGLHSMVVVE